MQEGEWKTEREINEEKINNKEEEEEEEEEEAELKKID